MFSYASKSKDMVHTDSYNKLYGKNKEKYRIRHIREHNASIA